MSDASLRSWSYYRDDRYCCPRDALREQYPQLLKKNEQLRMAVFQIDAAEALIDQIMADLQDKAEDDDETY